MLNDDKHQELPEAPVAPDNEIEGEDALSVASEYLELSRRWRKANPPLQDAEIRRWRFLRENLESVLTKGEAEQGASKRRFLRVPSRIQIQFSDGMLDFNGWLTELGEGGVFVETPEPFAPGSVLKLEIVTTNGGPMQRIMVEGLVRWTRPERSDAGPSGMGLSFEALGDSQYEEILALLGEALFLTLSANSA